MIRPSPGTTSGQRRSTREPGEGQATRVSELWGMCSLTFALGRLPAAAQAAPGQVVQDRLLCLVLTVCPFPRCTLVTRSPSLPTPPRPARAASKSERQKATANIPL
jgi:hypothetical protein